MGAGLDNAPVLDDDDAVGALRGREAVGDEDRRAPLQEPGQGLLDDRLAALQSDARLADIAARMGMREPQRFAVVRVQIPQVARVPSRIKVLSSLAGFLVPAIAARP